MHISKLQDYKEKEGYDHSENQVSGYLCWGGHTAIRKAHSGASSATGIFFLDLGSEYMVLLHNHPLNCVLILDEFSQYVLFSK